MTGLNEAVLLDAFLSDLRSDDLLLRELAVSQLSRFTHLPQTLAALQAAETAEPDQELKRQISTLIRLISAEQEPTKAKKPSYSGLIDEKKITSDWFSGEINRCSELLERMQGLPDSLKIRATVTVIENETELHRLIPMFKWPPELIADTAVLKAFASRIGNNDSIFTLRLISFLAANDSGLLARNLQTLLRDPNSLVRAEAVRFLFKLSKPHALRLMEELILSSARNRRAASTFLLLLPFNDIKHLVLSLIECGSLKNAFLQKLIYHLVYNNPDLDFFKRLTVIEVLRRDEIPEIAALRLEAAEALAITEMISEEKSTFCRNSLVKIADYIRSKSGISLKLETEQESATSSEVSPATAKVIPTSSHQNEATSGERLVSILSQKSCAVSDREFIIQLLSSPLNEQDKGLLLKVIYKFKPADPAVISWLEHTLEKFDSGDAMLSMKLLAEMSSARLLPHLPVLCLNENETTSIFAIRLFRKHNPKMFIKQVEKWLHEDSEATWKAARAAMLMMSIEESRSILTRAFYSTQRISMIRFFAPIFRVSPDHITLYELERLLDTCRGKKKEILVEEISLLKEALGLVSQTEADNAESTGKFAALQIGWDEFCKGLEKIRYISQNQMISDMAVNFLERHRGKLAILLAIIVAVMFWPNNEMSITVTPDKQTARSEFKLIQQPPVVHKGEVKVFELVEYEPITRLWRARSLNGEPFKLKLSNYNDFQKGFKGNFLVTDYRVSTLGHAIVFCRPSD